MTIYTGRGDGGMTDLRGGIRVSKASPRIEAYGTVDELNALLGTIHGTEHDDLDQLLFSIQQDLHVIQAVLASTDTDGDGPAIEPDDVERLESSIDRFNEDIEPLQHFILPGGGLIGAHLHHARTVCRRAERRVIALRESESIDTPILTYLNRLSDLLFVLGRVINHRDGEPEERPTY